ncbi:MAG: hypothetical protein AAB444_00545 [Patescibacteria group bacterium]
MNIPILKTVMSDPEKAILRCGYGKIVNRQSRETSFARRFHGDMYPRFHVYINERPEVWVFSLHLDQKQPTYEGVSAHAGEYEGTVVEKEAARIQNLLVVQPPAE